MFCKWCGADLSDTAAKCPRCGRDIPAMSDCGGFYDLVPSVKRRFVQEDIPQSVPPKEDPVRVDPTKNERLKKDDPAKGKKNVWRKNNGFQNVPIFVGLLVLIALLISLNTKIGDVFSKLDQVGKDIDCISSKLNQNTEPSEESTATQPTEESVSNEPPLKEQNIKIDVSGRAHRSGFYCENNSGSGRFRRCGS